MMSKLPSLCQRGENRVHHETSPGIVYTHFQVRGRLMVMENSEHTIKMPRQILQRDDFLGDVLALKVCVRASTVTATSECL